MKKITLLTITFLLSLVAVHAQKAPLTVTIDYKEVFDNFWKVKEDQSKFQNSVQRTQEMLENLKTERAELGKELEDLDKKTKSPNMSETGKAEAKAEFDEKLPIFQQKTRELELQTQAAQQNLNRNRQQIIQMHAEAIRKVVAEVAKGKGADLVLNSNGDIVIYSSTDMDITAEVLNVLNADQPAN